MNPRERLNYLNFNQLRSFYAVARELSFTKAADLLCIGQPTVTTQVKSLEDTYGRQLFRRTTTGVELTQDGEALLQIARQIFALDHRAHALLTSRAEVSGQLHIGTVGPFFVMKLLAEYSDRLPLVHVTLESGGSDLIYRKLLDYQVDIAILGSDYGDPRLDLVLLGEHEVMLLLPVTHPWAQRKSVAVEELDGVRMILREQGSMTRRAFETVLAARKVHPSVVMELARDSMIEATAAGLGLGILSRTEFDSDPRLVCLPFARDRPVTRAYVACLKERRGIGAINAFIELARSSSPTPAERGPANADSEGASQQELQDLVPQSLRNLIPLRRTVKQNRVQNG